ncbi:MAG: hypothetical protein JRI96_05405 [Deltaproteobacteria bacterium]|nr:hypothetical protein [Deltaproteobacteria bacterium]
MGNSLKYLKDKQYRDILNEVGRYSYRIFDKDELVPGNIFGGITGHQDYNYVVAGTGATISIYTFTHTLNQNIIIPKDTPLFVARLLRYDDAHGKPHYNADDQIIFQTIKGNILRMSRKDAPDHFIKLTKKANLFTIAEAYKLPNKKSGPVEQYSENGSSLPIEILLANDIEENKGLI